MNRVPRSGRIHPTRRGFTLIEMLVTITIIVALAVLSFYGVTRMRESAFQSSSASNMRQLGVAIFSFSSDNNGYLPASRKGGGTYWPEIIWSSLESRQTYLRPGTKDRANSSALNDNDGYFPLPDSAAMTPQKQPIRWNYVINGGYASLPFCELYPENGQPSTPATGLSRPLGQIEDPTRTIMLGEGNANFWTNGDAGQNSKAFRKWSNGKTNILWFDGSVRMMNPNDLRLTDFYAKK